MWENSEDIKGSKCVHFLSNEYELYVLKIKNQYELNVVLEYELPESHLLFCSGQTYSNAYVGVILSIFCKPRLCLLFAISFTVLDMFVATTLTHAKQ
jgi:hypothetical protein